MYFFETHLVRLQNLVLPLMASLVLGFIATDRLCAADLPLKRVGSWPGSVVTEIMLRRYSASSYDVYPFAQSVGISGNHVYLADASAGLHVIDISDPNRLRRVAGYHYNIGTALDVAVSGDYAYLADGYDGLAVIDIRNPAMPRAIGRYELPGEYFAGSVVVSGNYAYVLHWYRSGSEGLDILAISDPTHPVRVGRYETSRHVSDVAVSGNFAYVTPDYAGLEIIDVSDPARPMHVSDFETNRYPYSGAESVVVSGNYAYLADGWNGLRILDVRDKAKPREVGSILTRTPSSGWTVSVSLSSNLCYVSDRFTGLHVIDVSDPTNPRRVARNPGLSASQSVIEGAHAFVAAGTNGLIILERYSSVEKLAIQQIASIVNRSHSINKTALRTFLTKASAAITENHFTGAVSELRLFKRRVKATVRPVQPETAARLTEAADTLISLLQVKATPPLITRPDSNAFKVRFNGHSNGFYLIQASTNMSDWQTIGSPRQLTSGIFDFADPQQSQRPARFYRILQP